MNNDCAMIVGRVTCTTENVDGVREYARWIYLGETEETVKRNADYTFKYLCVSMHIEIKWKFDDIQREIFYTAFPEFRVDPFEDLFDFETVLVWEKTSEYKW